MRQGLISRSDGAKAVTKPVGIIPAGSEGTLAKISTYFNPFAAVCVCVCVCVCVYTTYFNPSAAVCFMLTSHKHIIQNIWTA
jgi:hypothetical protein